MTLAPDIRDSLRALANRLDSASHGARRSLVEAEAKFLGLSTQTLYRKLKEVAGWSSGRKARADKGATSMDETVVQTIAAMKKETMRLNGKQTMFTTVARSLATVNGMEVTVSNAQLNRLMKARKLDVASQRAVDPVQQLRSLHPNHVHQVDPSLCLLYYMPTGEQHMMREDRFYKNKLENFVKVKLKVWRYVLYDHASATVIPWYIEAAGENQHNLFQFLMFAWSKQEGRLFHGVPKIVLWDKGTANTSAAIKNMLRNLEVEPIEHEAGHARVKGGVENANNLVETQFESRLKLEPVNNVDELNLAAFHWANAYNGNLLIDQDTRLRRHGLAQPIARYDLWQLIAADQLRILPPVEICRALLAGRTHERTVSPRMEVSFKHPQSDRSLSYSLRGLDGICVDDKVQVRPLVYGDCAIQIEAPRYDGEMLIYKLEPERNFDAFGFAANSPVIGEEYRAAPTTAIERAAKDMEALAYPGATQEEAKKARDKNVTPFGGQINSHSYIKDIEQPTYMPRRGEDIETPAHIRVEVPKLNATQVALRVYDALKRSLTSDEYTWIQGRYADGVPEDQIEQLIQQFTQPAEQPKQVAAGGLKLV